MMFPHVVNEISFNYISIFSTGGHFVRAILVEGIMRNISVKIFCIWTKVQEMSFKGISYLELWQPLCST